MQQCGLGWRVASLGALVDSWGTPQFMSLGVLAVIPTEVFEQSLLKATRCDRRMSETEKAQRNGGC